MARSPHRTGRAWRQARAEMFARYGRHCYLCGHPGAGEAGHVEAVANNPGQRVSADVLRPMHGSNYPCPTCVGNNGLGRACNQELGTRSLDQAFKPAHEW